MDFEHSHASAAVPGDATLIALERQRLANVRTRWALGAALLLGAAVSAFFWFANAGSSLPPAPELAAAAPPAQTAASPVEQAAPAPAAEAGTPAPAPGNSEPPPAPPAPAADPAAAAPELAADVDPAADSKASFDLFVEPSGARVVLDGDELGLAPLRVTNVLVGAHRLEVFGPAGYESASREIVLGADKREIIEIQLDEVAEAGEVLVEFASEPVGADVVVLADGQSMHLGPTPVTVRLNRALDYHAVFTKDGYGVETRSVVAEGDRVRVVAELNRKDTGDAELLAAAETAGEDAPASLDADDAPEAVDALVEPEPEPEQLARTLSRAERERADERRRAREDAERKSSRRERRKARSESRRARTGRSRQRKSAVAARSIEAPKKARAQAGAGTLMLGAKPPCKIYVDGKATGLMTPQRALPLSPGRHRIKLVNAEHGIKSEFTVSIKAGSTTRVIRDLTSKM